MTCNSADLVGRLGRRAHFIERWSITSSPERHKALEAEAECAAPELREAAAEIERLAKERDDAASYLRGVLISFVNEHCDPIAEWRPLPDLLGRLTQIDNASTVARELKARALASESKLREIEAATLKERDDCQGAVDSIDLSRDKSNETQNSNRRFYEGRVASSDEILSAIRSQAQGAPIPHDTERFSKLSNEPPARLPEGYSAPLDVRTTTELIIEAAAQASQGKKK